MTKTHTVAIVLRPTATVETCCIKRVLLHVECDGPATFVAAWIRKWVRDCSLGEIEVLRIE